MGKHEKQKERDSNRVFILALLLLILLAIFFISATIWGLFIHEREPDVVLTPDYAPVEMEENAETIQGETTTEKNEAAEGGGSVSLTYTTDVSIDLSSKTASLYFANPSRSTHNMVLQIAVQDTILVQSGTLEPGNLVRSLNLLDGAEKQLQPGGYEGKFIVLYYDSETSEKAVLNTEIPIKIEVTQ